ncbi:MAG: 16S rRNA (guanine(966)-N(2))-methyltransferase RsmD [Candidatus Omnitrophica bacterium CG11_big_fil_rev_8_21_14_0_20_63_9]|nr:MAG: 16S rRNA (guanine(966)-N(2))-methyltransferase RsmD [Candidatus Omnitrophica bacterium CG11_big_fil_rev_8_21_14_0_20_63_9]
MSRITGGEFKGFTLKIPGKLRATEAKVRQALFNILGSFIEGARVVDGFAGSGALGCEALSRGAEFVAFIESDGEAAVTIRDNLAKLSPEVPPEAWRVLNLDIERGFRTLAEREAPFDVVLLDPPYRADQGKKALNALVDCAILAPTGLVAVEHERRAILPVTIGPLSQWKQHRYGDTVLSFYRRTHEIASDLPRHV